MLTILTAGYGNDKRAEELLQRAIALNALVVDVRETPWSSRSEWCRTNLVRQFSLARYAWWGQLWGNPLHRQGQIAISDFEGGLTCLRRREQSGRYDAVILLCGCKAEKDCHRAEIVRRLREVGYAPEPLLWTPAPEPVIAAAGGQVQPAMWFGEEGV